MQAWQNNLLATGIASKTVAEDFEEKFSDFYLSNTYLAGNNEAPAPSCGVSSCC
jgi:glutathione S-transferase